MLGSLSVISTTVLALYVTLLQTAESATVSPFIPDAALKGRKQWKSAAGGICDDIGTWAPVLMRISCAFHVQGYRYAILRGSYLDFEEHRLAAMLFNIFIFVYPLVTAWLIMSIAWEQMMRREVYYIMLHYKVRLQGYIRELLYTMC